VQIAIALSHRSFLRAYSSSSSSSSSSVDAKIVPDSICFTRNTDHINNASMLKPVTVPLLLTE
jgi:hypothetical protein